MKIAFRILSLLILGWLVVPYFLPEQVKLRAQASLYHPAAIALHLLYNCSYDARLFYSWGFLSKGGQARLDRAGTCLNIAVWIPSPNPYYEQLIRGERAHWLRHAGRTDEAIDAWVSLAREEQVSFFLYVDTDQEWAWGEAGVVALEAGDFHRAIAIADEGLQLIQSEDFIERYLAVPDEFLPPLSLSNRRLAENGERPFFTNSIFNLNRIKLSALLSLGDIDAAAEVWDALSTNEAFSQETEWLSRIRMRYEFRVGLMTDDRELLERSLASLRALVDAETLRLTSDTYPVDWENLSAVSAVFELLAELDQCDDALALAATMAIGQNLPEQWTKPADLNLRTDYDWYSYQCQIASMTGSTEIAAHACSIELEFWESLSPDEVMAFNIAAPAEPPVPPEPADCFAN